MRDLGTTQQFLLIIGALWLSVAMVAAWKGVGFGWRLRSVDMRSPTIVWVYLMSILAYLGWTIPLLIVFWHGKQ